MQTRGPVTTLAGRYALDEELGRSGAGMLWRATDTVLGRTVTVKLVHPDLADDAAFTARLAEEARKVAALEAPGLARLLDTGEEDGVVFLVREYVEGTSARGVLEARGPLLPAEAVRIVMAVLEALAPAHEAGRLHLDLEVEDVLLDPDGGVRVTDVGIGAAVCAAYGPADRVRLLGDGLAPELASDAPPDARADVYAVGALLFELLSGEPPRGRTSPRALRSKVPWELDRIVGRALARDPAERFPDVRSFAAALAPSAGPSGEQMPPAGAAGHRPIAWLRAWLAVPLLIVGAAAAAIAVGLWLGRLEVGGPLGIRPAGRGPAEAASTVSTIRPIGVVAFDPFGDGSENDPAAPLAADGDRSTVWHTENYFDGRLNKPGVGLVFDLGEPRQVSGFRLWTPHPGYRFAVAVGDDPEALVAVARATLTAAADTRGPLRGTGRYVLVWITSVVPTGDGNRAEVAELRVTVRDA